MQAEAEALRASDPDRARGIELMIREGERQMTAFEQGERYVPSPEMVSHAQDMFRDWESGMLAQGAPPEFVEAARNEFARWSSGEMQVAFGGPGHDVAGPHGGPPSVEQMQAMGMTTEQIQMAQQYEAGSNFGINPSTGGWEPNMGGSTSAYMPEGWARDQSGTMHYVGSEGTTYGSGWEGGSNYGINPATGGWEPNMGGGTVYSDGTWTSSTGETWTHTGNETWTSSTSTELRQETQSNTTTAAQERYETATHLHEGNVEHQHTIHVHADGTRHDHTATSPADVAPNSVFQ